jgi:diacylglycerol kinase
MAAGLMIPEQNMHQLVFLLCCVLCFFFMWGAQKLTHILQNYIIIRIILYICIYS